MSVLNDIKPNLNICRCCLREEECCKDISNVYYFGEKKEKYYDMILDTFNIHISYPDQSSVRLICKRCIKSLRAAANFKKQVIHAEKTICTRVNSPNKDFVGYSNLTRKLKFEPGDEFIDNDIYDDFDDHQNRDNHDFKWSNNPVADTEADTVIVKLEPVDDIPAIVQAVTTDRTRGVRKKNIHSKKTSSKVKTLDKADIDDESKKTAKESISKSHVEMRENSLKLILNSNMVLFKSLKTKFACVQCKESYFDIKELREHSKTHTNTKKLTLCVNRMKGLSFKNVDISSLSCKLCSEMCDDINHLQNHLASAHKMEFADAGNLLVPYKLENDFECVICHLKFGTYLRLSIHMNVHYTNNVCEICGVSYINRMSLRIHVHSMHKEKKCTVCSATFLTNYLRVKHMRKYHNASLSKRYCLTCNKTFQYTYKLLQHRIEEHGAKRPVSTCGECGKNFPTPQNLRVHIRSVHIRERNYPCSVCDMRFFTKCDQKRHERTHEDTKLFACGFCESKFKSKDSWRRHVRRQHAHYVGDQF